MRTKTSKHNVLDQIEPPAKFITSWQKIVDLLAKSTHVSAALIMRIHARELEVFVTSQNEGTPYRKGDRVKLNMGLYCETVIDTRKELLVANALKDPKWDHNPDIELGMVSYCGLPITWPSGDMFGTICILDNKENHFSEHDRELLEQFRDLVEASLETVYENFMVEATNKKLAKAIEQIPTSIIITSMDGNIEYVNPAFEQITGYTFDEVLGQNPRILKSGEMSKKEYKNLWDTILSGNVWHGDLQNKRKDGRLVWVRATIFSIHNGAASITGFLAIEEDITSLKKSELAVRESEERFNSFVTHSPNKIHIKDVNGRYLMINPQCEKLFGVTNAEAKGKRAADIFPDNMRDKFNAHDQAVLKTGQAIQQEEVFTTDDGKRTYLTVKFPIHNADGDIVFVGSSGIDITERKAAEEKLSMVLASLEQRVEERTNTLIEEIKERRIIEGQLRERTKLLQLFYSVADTANKEGSHERAMRGILKEICNYIGWPIAHFYSVQRNKPDKLSSSGIWYMNDPLRFSNFRNITEKNVFESGVCLPGRVLASGEAIWISDVTKDSNFPRARMEKDIGIKAGFALPVMVGTHTGGVLEFYSPRVLERDGQLLDTVQHITMVLGRLIERSEAERALHKARENADAANQAKTEFLSSMSHELRTPLNAIIGFSDMMLHKVFGPIGNAHYDDYAHDINNSGHHLLDLINDILDLSKIEAGKFELHLEDVDTVSLVESCISLVSGRAADANVHLIIDIDQCPTLVEGDMRKLKQVLINLLTNAIKFTPADGRVTLRVALTVDGGVRFEVSDTGIGIAEQDIPKVMEPFGQADNPLSRNQEGTGLGLPLSKALMELHSGTLDLKSILGEGCCVTATLPPSGAQNTTITSK